MWNDLAEHTGMLVAVIGTFAALIGVFATLAGFFFWRLITGIDKKTNMIAEYLLETCGSREAKCLDKFVQKKEFDKWQEGRDGPGGLWEAINHHRHEQNGKVTRI